ncbi:DNA polymerase III subunit beta [bacterium]|nr:DNA polymerase III subunit beta [bacterium]
MHISCEKNKLKSAIDQVSKAITSKQLLPILGHILFETTEDNKLKLTASSLDIGITCKIETDEIREPGTTTCSAKVISEIVNNMPSGLINLDIDSNINSELIVSNNFSIFKVMTLPSEEFPKSIKPQECESINVSAEDFCDAVNKSAISIADSSESRPIMQGLSIKFAGDEIHFVSTDGKRLSKAVVKTAENREKDQIIVPGKPLNELLKIINKEESIQIQYSKTHLFVNTENTSFFCKLIEGSYPDYEKVIPKSFQGVCKLSKDIITSAINRMMIMAKDRDIPNVVKFHFADDKLSLSAETNSLGSANENLDVIYQGEELKIAFNGKFILDALKVLDEDEITLRLQDNKNSMAIQNEEDDQSFIYICMPIRTR